MARVFPKWPSWFYGPDGEAKIFQHEDDVPPGWKDTPFPPMPEPKVPPAAPLGPTRDEMIAELTAAGVELKRNFSTAKIRELFDKL